jgi:hypothetical protein
MDLIMRDFVTAKERLNFLNPALIDFAGRECMGCGQTSDEIAQNDGWTDDDFDNNSRTTVEGNWYCQIDCYKDSR